MHLHVTDIVCSRGERRVLGPLSFELGAGHILVVTGKNGAGKSTLLSLIANRLQPQTGSVQLKAQTGEIDEDDRARHCHWVGHREGLKTTLTVRENLEDAQALLGGPPRSLQNALEALDIEALSDIPVGYLSAGQRKRVALARLNVVWRPLWLLDEPTSALDTASQTRVFNMMQNHLDANGLIVVATHLPLDVNGARVHHLTLDERPRT